MKISFCIPTLNRPEYLINTIRSICSNKCYSSQFEIYIYNNFSDLDYTEVEEEISRLSEEFIIKYKRGVIRLDIDQSMFEAIRMAEGEYLFFIGDDDFLTDDGIKDIFDLLKETDFDLAIFNALRVSDSTTEKYELIGMFDKTYSNFDSALLELKEFCTFGNLLIKREFVNEDDFKYLFGTSHAYGCFWLSFFREYEKDKIPKIIVPKKSVVCLRIVEKSYDIMEVTFAHSFLEHKLFVNVIGENSKKLLSKFNQKLYRKFANLKFLVRLGIAKNDLSRIKKINIDFYNQNRFKIFFSMFLVNLLLFFKIPIKKVLEIGWIHDIVRKSSNG